ncbi:hypothetical protein AX14_008965 [Amanita brunnescens Koide BX004]|nr:hypothetical protein AX14_008965 [Amanita brunnescens Koide BX004]
MMRVNPISVVRAWATAKALPPSELKQQPYLKTTGIAIALGSMLESTGHPDKAYDIYSDALSHLQDAGSKQPLSIEEQMRGVTLSCKLAEMTNAMGRGDVEEEARLVWAVEVILKNIMPAMVPGKEHDVASQQDHASLDLPSWVSATDLATPFEALGSLYVRNGNDEYALPLFLQAISFLIPPPPKTSPAVNRCQGAQTMSSISDLIIRVNPTSDGIVQAESWSRKALDITTDARSKLRQESSKWFSSTPKTDPTCEFALAVSLYNIGVLRAMVKDRKEAMRFLKMSLEQSESVGLKEGAAAAKTMLWSVEHNLM